MRAAALLAFATVLWPVGAAAEPVRIRFVYSGADDAEHDYFRGAIEDFNRAQEEIVVEPVSRLWTGYAIHDSLVRHLALQDPAVDVYLVDLPWIAEFADAGWLLPLDGRLAAPADETFLPDSLLGGRYRGELYGLPFSLKGNVLYYRRDLLERRGLEPPRTLAELASAARLVQSEDQIPVGLALHGLYLYNDFLPMLWGSGADVLSPDGEVGLRAPGARDALGALVGLFDGEPPIAPPRDDFFGEYAQTYGHPVEVFARGDAVFLIAWSRNARQLSEATSAVRDLYGVTAIPGTREPGPTNLGSYYLAVNRASRHPTEAIRFVEHMTSAALQRRAYEELRELPSRRDLHERSTELTTDPSMVAMAAALTRARTRPRVPNEREVGAVLEDALRSAIRGHAPPEDALENAARGIEAARIASERPHGDPERGLPDDAYDAGDALGALPIVPLGIALFVPLALVTVLAVRRRYRLDVLTTLSSKLILAGMFVILELMLVAIGMMTAQSMRTQRRELAESRAFLREQMADHAMTIGKNLALSSSLLFDLEPEDAERSASAQSQLLMASHFSDDILFLQLVDPSGAVMYSGRDALYGMGAGEHEAEGLAYPAARDLAAQVRRRVPVIRERESGSPGAYLEVLVPVFRRGVHQGALRLGVSEERLERQHAAVQGRYDAQVRQILLVAALVTVALLALGAFGILVFSRRISSPVVELTEKARRIREGRLDVEITPRSRDEIGTLAATMSEMVQGLRDRDFIRATLGRYVAEEVADRFVNDPKSLELGGHLRFATILMADLRGFTPMSERLAPDVLVGLLNRYLAAMTDVIEAHGGTVDELIGDAILAVFGMLDEKPDDAERAVTCAVAMQQALLAVNRENVELGLPGLSMGIGLNSGEVIAGNIGSDRRAKYGVVGSVVNAAARVESFTVGDDVLLSQATYDLVRDRVTVDEPVRAHVKGKSEPMTLYPVLSVVGRPELVVPGAGARRRAVVRHEAQCFTIEGKEVEAVPTVATVVELGETSVLLEIERQIPVHTNVKLRVEHEQASWTSDIYAKCIACTVHPGAGYLVELAITSASEEDRATIVALIA